MPATTPRNHEAGSVHTRYSRAAELFEQATVERPGDRWKPHQLRHRVLTHAAEDGAHTSTPLAYPGRGLVLLAALSLMLSCAERGCRLESIHEVRRAHRYGESMNPRPVPDAVAALDRLTFEGIATTAVTLPSRTVRVGVWLRLLRTLLDEVSMVESRAGPGSAALLHKIWDAADLPFGAGLSFWRPYERLSPPSQEAMLHAAATAVQLAANGTIIPGGTLGSALQPAPNQR